MFEKIVLRRSSLGRNITIGELSEALLFYQNVHLLIDHGTFGDLVDAIGMERLLSLLARPGVTAAYCDETLGTQTQTYGTAIHAHSFVAFSFAGHDKVGELKTRQKKFAYLLKEQGYSGRQADKLADRFQTRVPALKLTDERLPGGGVTKAAYEDLFNASYVRDAVRNVLLEEGRRRCHPREL